MAGEGYSDYRLFQDCGPNDPIPKMDDETTKKYVYLTFDDGLQPGTKEILDVMDEEGVPGTFFLVGVHTEFYLKHINEREGMNLMLRLYRKHLIANHTYSHAHNKYPHFYGVGTPLPKSLPPRSVLEDFQKNEEVLRDIVIKSGAPFYEEFKFKVARFPGRNTWRIPGIKQIDPFNSKDTATETEQLFSDNYMIYGWDTEWDVDWAHASTYVSGLDSVAHFDTSTTESSLPLEWDWAEDHPFFDFSRDDLDLVNETELKVKSDILSMASGGVPAGHGPVKRPGKVVLLIHDRTFRDLKSSRPVEKLRLLIQDLKKEGFIFSTLDRY